MTQQHCYSFIDHKKVLVVFHKGEYTKIDLDDIVYIEARRNHSLLFLKGKPAGILLSSSVGTLAQLLSPNMFCQVNRSQIIGLKHLVKMNRQKTRVYYDTDKTLDVTEGYVEELCARLHVIR